MRCLGVAAMDDVEIWFGFLGEKNHLPGPRFAIDYLSSNTMGVLEGISRFWSRECRLPPRMSKPS